MGAGPAEDEGSAAAAAEARRRAAEAFVEAEEGATSRFRGLLAKVATALLVAMSVFHLYAAVEIVGAQVLRPVHVGFVLVLVFLLFPALYVTILGPAYIKIIRVFTQGVVGSFR